MKNKNIAMDGAPAKLPQKSAQMKIGGHIPKTPIKTVGGSRKP